MLFPLCAFSFLANPPPPKFVVLLGLFVKPMLALQGSTPLGAASYRRVINRSVICTIGVAVAHVITAVVHVLALQGDTYETDKVCRFRGRGACSMISICVGTVVLKVILLLLLGLVTPTTE